MKLFRALLVTVISIILSGCPASIDVKLTNSTSNEIHILSGYSDATLLTIAPYEEKSVTYNLDCFRIKNKDSIIEFLPILPPKDYFETGAFSSKIYAKFVEEGKLVLYKHDGSSTDEIQLQAGCKKI